MPCHDKFPNFCFHYNPPMVCSCVAFLFLLCGVFVNFSFTARAAPAAADHPPRSFRRRFLTLYAPPLFLGVLILVRNVPTASPAGGHQTGRGSPPRHTTRQCRRSGSAPARSTGPPAGWGASRSTWRNTSPGFPTRSAVCLRQRSLHLRERLLHNVKVDVRLQCWQFRISSSSQFIPSACSVSLFIACGRPHWMIRAGSTAAQPAARCSDSAVSIPPSFPLLDGFSLDRALRVFWSCSMTSAPQYFFFV